MSAVFSELFNTGRFCLLSSLDGFTRCRGFDDARSFSTIPLRMLVGIFQHGGDRDSLGLLDLGRVLHDPAAADHDPSEH